MGILQIETKYWGIPIFAEKKQYKIGNSHF